MLNNLLEFKYSMSKISRFSIFKHKKLKMKKKKLWLLFNNSGAIVLKILHHNLNSTCETFMIHSNLKIRQTLSLQHVDSQFSFSIVTSLSFILDYQLDEEYLILCMCTHEPYLQFYISFSKSFFFLFSNIFPTKNTRNIKKI
jgi:hypothetical protein